MRIDIAYEGVRTEDGRLIRPGALRFREAPVSVTTGYDPAGTRVVGIAHSWGRDGETGLISCEVELHPVHGAHVDLESMNRHLDVKDVETHQEGDDLVVTGGEAAMVYLSGGPGSWPSLDVVRPAAALDPTGLEPGALDALSDEDLDPVHRMLAGEGSGALDEWSPEPADGEVGRPRKRPVVVAAARWNGTAAMATHLIDWVLSQGGTATYRCHGHDSFGECDFDEAEHRIVVSTLEGDMAVDHGDYVLQGVEGEFYPCKPGVFDKTYEWRSQSDDRALREAARARLEASLREGMGSEGASLPAGSVPTPAQAEWAAAWLAGQGFGR